MEEQECSFEEIHHLCTRPTIYLYWKRRRL